MTRAFRLGITGKIGSGKSTLSAVAAEYGIKVLEADSIAKEVMQNNPSVHSGIQSLFGEEAYSGGELNRPFIASKIFTDDNCRIELEKIVHPATLEVFENEFRKANPGEIVAVESAILFQTGFDDIFDALILVEANDDDIVLRETASGKFSKDDIQNRLKLQHYQSDWKEDADFVIANTGSEADFIGSCGALFEVIKIIAKQDLPEEPMRKVFE